MPLILGALGSLLVGLAREYLPGIVGRVLLTFGIGLVVHQVGFPAIKAFIQGKLGGVPSVIAAYFEAFGIGMFSTMVISALIAVRAQRVLLAKLQGS